MPRSVRPSPLVEYNPAMLLESTRDYYRSTWGFDPVTDCRTLSTGGFRYEESFPLSQDLPLQVVGVTICARVDWEGEDIRNRIVFLRIDAKGRRRKAIVECTHTVVYAGIASDAFAFAEDEAFTRKRFRPHSVTDADIAAKIIAEELCDELDGIRDDINRPVILPPWEHFAALKSYVAGIADMGVITLLRQSIIQNTNPSDDLPFRFNAEMHEQIVKALSAIAPHSMLRIYQDFTHELLDAHTPAEIVDQRMNNLTMFASTSKHKHWRFLLRDLDTPTLVNWFRYTEIADKFQDRLFSKPTLLAKAQMIAPDLPWDTLRHEWEARSEAEHLDFAAGFLPQDFCRRI